MTYKDTLDFLFSSLPQFQRIGAAAYKNSLDTTLALDKYFDHPHKNFKVIHVGGTNGKGSVSTMIQSVLVQAGYKVGLYTSPHLTDFRERITINSEMIPEQEVTNFVMNHKDIIKTLKPSFFEMSVALAFDYFRNQNIDIAVIEVGMGGRLDSTNIVNPIASVITNISYDHTLFLGNTLEKIAAEKAGIIKLNIPIVIGQTQPKIIQLFEEKAGKLMAQIYQADKRFKASVDTEDGKFVVVNDVENGVEYKLNMTLKGDYQSYNLVTALALIDIVKSQLNISQAHIIEGLEKADIRGRWQTLGTEPLVICDTAHNVAGIRFVVEQIMRQSYKKLYVVLGAVSDKDVDEMLMLMPKGAYYLFTQASVERAMPAGELKKRAVDLGLNGIETDTVKEAFEKAMKRAKKNDMIFVGGSTFVVADLLEIMGK